MTFKILSSSRPISSGLFNTVDARFSPFEVAVKFVTAIMGATPSDFAA
jgi:hypothetical protein